ncbi:EAL domain-containing protein [Undibacterium flavidum]|uniref:EAL domain-containing protein n=1 Tax=Undibacterium flavidum TaxID=2762297 RepID=A0ABR6YC01_9BURK|nr:EAL domain-containing protein [Undibacterium flavidum]MBC3873997.1 EAL domain-containing protein [Undibacterium flavidum]
MNYPALTRYIQHLQNKLPANTNLYFDEDGRVHGRFFHARLASVYQTICSANTLEVKACEAYARSVSNEEPGLSIWKLLENIASDEESVELDRLCRLLHTINYFKQLDNSVKDLYLTVHNRLLVAVAGNHGAAFRRVLESLELPQQKVILQLPRITPSQRWVLSHVAENYRRNGFRIGANAGSLDEAHDLLIRIRPASIKLDVGLVNEARNFQHLLKNAAEIGTQIVVRKIETEQSYLSLQEYYDGTSPFLVQGYFFDLPKSDTPTRFLAKPKELGLASDAILALPL